MTNIPASINSNSDNGQNCRAPKNGHSKVFTFPVFVNCSGHVGRCIKMKARAPQSHFLKRFDLPDQSARATSPPLLPVSPGFLIKARLLAGCPRSARTLPLKPQPGIKYSAAEPFDITPRVPAELSPEQNTDSKVTISIH